MATQVKHRRGTDAEILASVPAIGELWFNTTDNSIHMGDGVTPGGNKTPNQNHTDARYTFKFTGVSELKTGVTADGTHVTFTIGQTCIIIDRNNAMFKIEALGLDNDMDSILVEGGLSANLVIDGLVSLAHIGANINGTEDDSVFITRACELGGFRLPDNATTLYDNPTPVPARDGLVIRGGYNSVIKLGGVEGVGGYCFLKSDMVSTYRGIQIDSVEFDGQNIAQLDDDFYTPFPPGDPYFGFNKNVIRLNSVVNLKMNHVRIINWWGLYKEALEGEILGVIGISNSRHVSMLDTFIDNSGQEGVCIHDSENVTVNTFYYKVNDGIRDNAQLFTALRVSPIGDIDPNSETASSDQSYLHNVTVVNALGSAVDIGGRNTTVTNHTYIDCRKGLNYSNEQFTGVQLEADSITIDGLVFRGKETSTDYAITFGLDTDTRTCNISNVHAQMALSESGDQSVLQSNGVFLANIDFLNLSNITVFNKLNGTCLEVRRRNLGNRCRVNASNIYLFGDNKVDYPSLNIQECQHAYFTNCEFTKARASLIDSSNVSFNNCEWYTADDHAIEIKDGNNSRLNITSCDFFGSLSYTLPYITCNDGVSDFAINSINISDSYFQTTTNPILVDALNAGRFQISNLDYDNTTLVSNATSGVRTTLAPGLQYGDGWKTPMEFGNGFLWLDGTTKLRVSSNFPTSDSDGVPV